MGSRRSGHSLHDHSRSLTSSSLQTAVQTEKKKDSFSISYWQKCLRFFTEQSNLLQWISFGGIMLLATVLRFWNLGDRPLHHDESLHAYYSMQLFHDMQDWQACFHKTISCYVYNPLLHGPFQFHIIALVYAISAAVGAPDHGINTTTVRIAAAVLGTLLVAIPYLMRPYLSSPAALLSCFLLAISPSMVYYARFAREDIYMAFFTILLVAAAGRYVRGRKAFWLVLASLALSFSYATKEATFLTIALFGSFLIGLIAWEIGSLIPLRQRFSGQRTRRERKLQMQGPYKTASLRALLLLLFIALPVAGLGFIWMKRLTTYINANTSASDLYVQHLKSQTLVVLPWLCLVFSLYAIGAVLWNRKYPYQPARDWRDRLDPEKQPVLFAIANMPWMHWLLALLAFVAVFVVLFSVLFTNFPDGIADGIWQGVYYWLQQQQVARGGQPWYYYLLLIPLYEQIGVGFSLIGCVYCVRHMTRFRLFLLYWFLGNLCIYTWASEKMPWLIIHIVMPMLILAAIGLEQVCVKFVALVQDWRSRSLALHHHGQVVRPGFALWIASGSLCMAFLLLVLTLQNMFQVTYVHDADAPYEMLLYVQTTTDVQTVMDQVARLDQKMTGGKHTLSIGVMGDASWPFYWYLRDYTNVCYGFPDGGCVESRPAVIISGGDSTRQSQMSYATDQNGKPAAYQFHLYRLRSWWDEGYKPAPCVESSLNSCQGQPQLGGVGLSLWLSYGDNPPANAHFDLGLALQHIWEWWWWRRPFGETTGATDMGLLIRSDLAVKP